MQPSEEQRQFGAWQPPAHIPQQPSAPPYPPYPSSAPPYPPAPPPYPPALPYPTGALPYPPPYQLGLPGYPGSVPVPPRTNSGAAVGIAIGGVLLLVLLLGGGFLLFKPSSSGAHPVSASASGSGSATTPATTDSYRPGSTTTRPGSTTTRPTATTTTYTPPRTTYRDETTLDSEKTDRTPMELQQFFWNNSVSGRSGASYTLAGAGFYSACDDAGGKQISGLLRANGCGNMAIAVYLNSGKTVMTTVMVMPLPDTASATNVSNAISTDNTYGNDLHYHCPRAPETGSQLCPTAPAGIRWWTSHKYYHRYFVIAMSLQTNGQNPSDSTVVGTASADCWVEVVSNILVIR